MKFTFLETTEKEEVVVYAKEKTSLITKIESLCKDDCNSLIGYFKDIIKELDIDEVECFITNKDKVFAISNKEVFLIKKRLYELSDLYPDKFTFINQSCLANLKKVDHFTCFSCRLDTKSLYPLLNITCKAPPILTVK